MRAGSKSIAELEVRLQKENPLVPVDRVALNGPYLSNLTSNL